MKLIAFYRLGVTVPTGRIAIYGGKIPRTPRRRVIEPAIEEINKKTNWNVTWEAEKIGRKVEKLWFYYNEIKM